MGTYKQNQGKYSFIKNSHSEVKFKSTDTLAILEFLCRNFNFNLLIALVIEFYNIISIA